MRKKWCLQWLILINKGWVRSLRWKTLWAMVSATNTHIFLWNASINLTAESTCCIIFGCNQQKSIYMKRLKRMNSFEPFAELLPSISTTDSSARLRRRGNFLFIYWCEPLIRKPIIWSWQFVFQRTANL